MGMEISFLPFESHLLHGGFNIFLKNHEAVVAFDADPENPRVSAAGREIAGALEAERKSRTGPGNMFKCIGDRAGF
jgi:hypothetical protein